MPSDLKQRKPKDVIFGNDLTIEWRDGIISHYPFFSLRDACPCAACVDENTGVKVLDPKTIPNDIRIADAEYIGNYALRFHWSDSHNTGIYTFRYLRQFFDMALEKGGYPGGPHPIKN